MWITFALLDPDPATQINANPDPQPCLAQYRYVHARQNLLFSVSRKQIEISDMPGDLWMPGRPCSVCSPLRPRAPRSGSSPIAQARAPAQPSFLNININMNTAVLRVFSTTAWGTTLSNNLTSSCGLLLISFLLKKQQQKNNAVDLLISIIHL
jgi:hypothetical protein